MGHLEKSMEKLSTDENNSKTQEEEFIKELTETNGQWSSGNGMSWYVEQETSDVSTDPLYISAHGSLYTKEDVILKHLQDCKVKVLKSEHKLILQLKTIKKSVYINVINNIQFNKLLRCAIYWSSFRRNGIYNKLSLTTNNDGPTSSSNTELLLKSEVKLLIDDNFKNATFSLNDNGLLEIDNDGNTVIDLKLLLKSEIRILNDNTMVIGILAKLRTQLGYYNGLSLHDIIIQYSSSFDLEKWFVYFNLFTVKESLALRNIDMSNGLTVSNKFTLSILEAELNDSPLIDVTKGLYAEISIWDHAYAKTSIIFNTLAPFWREEFNFNVNTRISSLKISVKDNAKTVIGFVNVTHNDIVDYNNNLLRLPIVKNDNLDLKLGVLSIQFDLHLNFILPSVNFKLMENLLSNNQCVEKLIENVVYNQAIKTNIKLDELSTILLDIYQSMNKEDMWFQCLIEKEFNNISTLIENNTSQNLNSSHIYSTLFRGNSLLTKSLEIYFNRIGRIYLNKSIGSILREIVKDNKSCEIDPARIQIDNQEEKNQIIKENGERLTYWVIEIWKSIFTTSNDLPKGIKTQLKLLRIKFDILSNTKNYNNENENEIKKIDNNKNLLNCLSGILFLRFFCPVLLNPKIFNIIENHPNESTRRTLTLITKILLNLSTVTLFGMKEPWMVDMNSFVNDNKKDLLDYINKVTEKNLDFTDKLLDLSEHSQPPKTSNVALLNTFDELPIYPYLIEKRLRFTELVTILTNFIKTRDQGMKMLKSTSMQNMTLISSLNSIPNIIETEMSSGATSPDTAKILEIGELEFEKITENNAEVFGYDLMKYLERRGTLSPTSDNQDHTKYFGETFETSEPMTQLEQEATLLSHKIHRIITLFNDYEYPHFDSIKSTSYINQLAHFTYYNDDNEVFVDFESDYENVEYIHKLFSLGTKTDQDLYEDWNSRLIESLESLSDPKHPDADTITNSHNISRLRSSRLSRIFLGSPSEHEADLSPQKKNRWFRKK